MNKTHIQHPMMIRTKKNNIVERTFSSFTSWNNVTNIVRRLIPTTNSTPISVKPFEASMQSFPKIRGIFINAFIPFASFSAKSNPRALMRTKSRLSLSPYRIIEWFSAHLAVFSFQGSRPVIAYRFIKTFKRTKFPGFCLAPVHYKFLLTCRANQGHFCSFRQASNFTLFRTINTLPIGMMLKRFSTKLANRTDLFRVSLLIFSPAVIRTKILSSLNITRLYLKLFSTSFTDHLNRHVLSPFPYSKLTRFLNKNVCAVVQIA